jgi:hypothetical protein
MPEINFANVDYSAINPDTLDLGTCDQTCALICQTFERGSHNTYKESAIFATMNRMLDNTDAFATVAQESLSGYLRQPSKPELSSSGATASTDESLQGVKIENTDVSTAGNAFGKTLLDWMKDCIPCGARMLALLELHPHVDLLGALEADLKGRLSVLTDLANLLSNVDMYADLCSLLGLLNFMCIPDLQRLIAMFVALLAQLAFEMDGLIGLLQALIAPLFAPILMSITSLLDQFTLTVLSPVDCIITAIDEQLRKIDYEVAQDVSRNLQEGSANLKEGLKGGLAELNQSIVDAKNYIKTKLEFYIDQVKAMLGELGFGDVAYLKISLKKLTLIRLIAFIGAIIAAIAKGQQLCSPGKSPEVSELDNFFTSFLNPNSSFSISINDDGSLHLDEKVPLLNSPNVFQFEGKSVINPDLAQQISTTAAELSRNVEVKIPCKLEVQTTDVEKVNRWISELDSAG